MHNHAACGGAGKGVAAQEPARQGAARHQLASQASSAGSLPGQAPPGGPPLEFCEPKLPRRFPSWSVLQITTNDTTLLPCPLVLPASSTPAWLDPVFLLRTLAHPGLLALYLLTLCIPALPAAHPLAHWPGALFLCAFSACTASVRCLTNVVLLVGLVVRFPGAATEARCREQPVW